MGLRLDANFRLLLHGEWLSKSRGRSSLFLFRDESEHGCS